MDMHSLPFELPENGKIFYLLSDSEVDGFNYYKQHGSDHGLDVSLKMAVTEFGRVLVVQVKEITNIVKKTFSKVNQKLKKLERNQPNILANSQSDKHISRIELARKQGIPEKLIETYLTDNKVNESAINSTNFGMYRELKKPSSSSTHVNSVGVPNEPLSFLNRILLFFKSLI